MSNLIAYIPVLNQRHLDWFARHPNSFVWLISQEMAQELLPRLARNMAAVPTEVQLSSIYHLPAKWRPRGVNVLFEDYLDLKRHLFFDKLIMADEDVCHDFAEKYFQPRSIAPEYEDIWARYDMLAVKRESPVMADVETSSLVTDQLRIKMAKKIAPHSPDWWRQVSAMLFHGDQLLAGACNDHLPTEYTTYIFGDPRLNVDAGQKGKYCSFHAEKAVICRAAKAGLATEGASIYTTVFPCEDCARAIGEAGIKEVFFEEGYSALDAQDVLRAKGVRMIQVKKC